MKKRRYALIIFSHILLHSFNSAALYLNRNLRSEIIIGARFSVRKNEISIRHRANMLKRGGATGPRGSVVNDVRSPGRIRDSL